MIRLARTALAGFALLAGCGSLQPCDHRDLHAKHGLVCVLVGLRDQPERDDRGCLLGTVAAEPTDAPVVVFVYQHHADGVQVIESSILPHPGQYSFAVPAGAYRVAAFEDGNRDLRYDPAHERAALYHDGRTVLVMPGQRVDRLYLTLRRDQPQRIEFEFTLPENRDRPSNHHCSTAGAST